MADRITTTFTTVRDAARDTGSVPSRAVNGRLPDDLFARTPGPDGTRPLIAQLGEVAVPFARGTDPDVVIAHPLHGLLAAQKLQDQMPVRALVRNPLAMIASMMSVEPKFRAEGLFPRVNEVYPQLAKSLRTLDDIDARRVTTVYHLFSQLAEAVPIQHVVRLEDLATTGGPALAGWLPGAETLPIPPPEPPRSCAKDCDTLITMGWALLDLPGPMWDYYRAQEVADYMRVLADEIGISLPI